MSSGYDKGRVIPMDRFWRKVARGPEDECWRWIGAKEPRGYGKLATVRGGVQLYHKAHRVALSSRLGREVSPGMVTDHLCKTLICVNPSHLEEVTQRVNIHRGGWGDAARARAQKTHCRHGHPLAGDNLILKPRPDGSVARACRLCALEASRRYEQKNIDIGRARRWRG